MKDTDYTALLCLVWVAPAAFAHHRILWGIFAALLLVTSTAVHIKEYYRRKRERLQGAQTGGK